MIGQYCNLHVIIMVQKNLKPSVPIDTTFDGGTNIIRCDGIGRKNELHHIFSST